MNITPVSLRIVIKGKAYESVTLSTRLGEDINNPPYGSADLEMELPNTAPFKSGDFITITGTDSCAYFGIIRSLSQSIRVLPNGIKVTRISLSSSSWAYLLMRGEFKQTLNRDIGDIAKVDKSAIFKVADYKEGILKVLREELEEQSEPAVVLEKFIRELAHYKLQDGTSRLSDYIGVFDGSNLKNDTPYLFDEPRSVVKGVLLTQYKGAYSNNMSHWNIIRQLFHVFPHLIELFCFTHPAGEDNILGGVKLGVMFRYKPLNPTRAYQYALMQEYFEGNTHTVPTINKNTVVEHKYSFNEEDHINLVFIENPFASSEGHTVNMFRKNTAPILDAEDINKRGLRSFSATSPFVASRGTSPKVKADNALLHNALAQRTFLTIGLGGNFCRGTITQVAGTPLIAGQWASFDGFTFYITRVSKSYVKSPEGVLATNYVYTFERGSFENEVVSFTEPNFPEETDARPINKKKKQT